MFVEMVGHLCYKNPVFGDVVVVYDDMECHSFVPVGMVVYPCFGRFVFGE